jgi:SulP family sulfate permease
VLILRLDGQIYYANALTVRDQVKSLIGQSVQPPQAVLFDASVQVSLDITSAEVLKGLVKELHDQEIAVYIAEVHTPVVEFSRRTGLLDLIGEDHIYPTVDAAVQAIEAASA